MPAFSFSDEQLLFLLLGLFYALECVSILGKPAFCFRPAWRSDHRTEPSSFLASGDRGVVFHGVLPFQQSFQCQYFPWDLDEHGILLPVEEEPLLNGNPTTVSLRLVLFTELAELTVSGSHLFCGEEIRLSCSSPRFAQAAFRRFCQIRDAAPADRGHVIQQQITAAFDVASLEQKYRRFRKLTRPLQLASSAWALWTLGSIALRNFWPQGVRSDVAFMVALMGFVLFWILTAWTLLRANRVLQVSRGREWSHHLCQLLLTPSAAMRSPDWMSRHLFEDEDPLTV
ncbi:MAG TPA: hypothetical protein VNQ76_19955, partial [Planctomicrobium sp.]|nr:hypothetical protein [Planctomicrobium sp.]